MNLRECIADIPNFPKEGIVFRDVSPLLASPQALAHAIDLIHVQWEGCFDAIAALDARGFIFGAALAMVAGRPMVMLRKKGKLPGKTYSLAYGLEYGLDVLEVQTGAFQAGTRVLVIDDLLATGGTAVAACALVEQAGAVVAGCSFIAELADLGGREALKGREIQSLVVYEGSGM